MKRIVIDASSAILLFKAGLFDDLTGTYQVVLAQSVYEEVSRPGYPGAKSFGRYYIDRRFEVCRVKRSTKISPHRTETLSALGDGEKDTIRLFLSGEGSFVVIDDGRGAGFCREHRIPYINSLLVARILLLTGNISEAVFQDKFDMLIRLGRYSRKIIDYALTCPAKEMAIFMPG
ncbi:MAG: hypothetical protein AB1427_03905 [Thermodesulfobacteriota bacterium]